LQISNGEHTNRTFFKSWAIQRKCSCSSLTDESDLPIYQCIIFQIEPISKIRLGFKSKLSFAKSRYSGARNGEKAEHTRSM
jgi:hypothetical protein